MEVVAVFDSDGLFGWLMVDGNLVLSNGVTF